jgi:ABC-type sugar transport system ATPase subunit
MLRLVVQVSGTTRKFAGSLMPLLDEPPHGVEGGAKAAIYDVNRDFAGDGTTVIVASSELPEVLASADRGMVFGGGHLVADFERGEMREQTILASAFRLEGRRAGAAHVGTCIHG